MSKQKIIFIVSNDLTNDQRMQKICSSLSRADFEVEIVGRILSNSSSLDESLSYKQTRLKLKYTKGKLFYMMLNFRLFWYLIFSKVDIISAVDMDTLLAGWLASKIKRKLLVFDAHEYFSEVPELVGRRREKAIWQRLENFLIPKVQWKYTVNNSLANIFNKKWEGSFEVIRNLPVPSSDSINFDFPSYKNKIIVYQGAVNMGRGLKELISIMPKLKDRGYKLHIYGDGDELRSMEWATIDQMEYIHFKGKVSPKELKELTPKAFVGVNLLENKGLNYYYSLANKFWDYAAAGIPQICMSFPEYEKINKEFEVAVLVKDLEESSLLQAFEKIENMSYVNLLKNNAQSLIQRQNWGIESKKMITFYKNIS